MEALFAPALATASVCVGLGYLHVRCLLRHDRALAEAQRLLRRHSSLG